MGVLLLNRVGRSFTSMHVRRPYPLQVLGLLCLLIVLTVWGCFASPPVSQDGEIAPQSVLIEMEEATRQQINQIRQQNGLQSLQRNKALTQIARNYSERMAVQNFFDHKDPSGNEAVQRVSSAGVTFTLIGENLYRGTNVPEPVQDAVKTWMDSPGHRENILRPVFSETGIGVWRIEETYYFTQLFMQPG